MFGFKGKKVTQDDFDLVDITRKLKGKAKVFSKEIHPAFKALTIVWDTIGGDHRYGVPEQEDIFFICLELYEQAKKAIFDNEVSGAFVFQQIKVFWDLSGVIPVYGYSFEYVNK